MSMGYTLRVSVLESCQLRCGYCLPCGSSEVSPSRTWLNGDQYKRLARAFFHLGIDKVRFTGGEPLLRKDLPAIVEIFAKELSHAHFALTTNGLLFISMSDALVSAGLDSITFHLDTLRDERYGQLMGRGRIKDVLKGVDRALDLGLTVKINTVIQKSRNDDELSNFLEFSRDMGVMVRFIEQMNTGSAPRHVRNTFMSGEEILKSISQRFELHPMGRRNISDPAEVFMAKGIGVEFGLIASDTRPFCSECMRIRLSVDGRIRTCLYEPRGTKLSLAPELGPEAILFDLKSIVANKSSFHPMMGSARPRSFSMSQVGG